MNNNFKPNNSKTIYDRANKVLRLSNRRNPISIANELGIKIHYSDDLKDLLGMYTVISKFRVIFLNSSLNDITTNIVVAHELGHDRLHRNIAKNQRLAIESSLFCINNQIEYEANAFASHILLDTSELISLIEHGYSIHQIAQTTRTHTELVLIKMKELNNLGYNFHIPLDLNRNFLKSMSPC